VNPVEVRGLRKEYRRKGKEPYVAVSGVDFTVAEGEIVGYAGPNGAGKSTTVKILTGVLMPTAGEARVAGLVPWRQRKALASRIGVVFGQRNALWDELPLRESFDLVRALYRIPAPAARQRVAELAGVLDLGPLLDQRPRTFSLGQRMRANLAAAVLPAPPVLFLDEPTIGLDVEAKAVVREFLAALNSREGTTVLLTTHDLDDMTALARRLMVIDHGRLVYDGTVDGLRSAYGAERVLMVDLRERPAGAFAVDEARLLRSEGHRHWLAFSRGTSAAEVIGRVLARYDVADLTLEEPDLEDVIRRIYRGEVSLPSG
jgi:ABC-2 type transport system ATP-binding protein